jgi:hypothetical protein
MYLLRPLLAIVLVLGVAVALSSSTASARPTEPVLLDSGQVGAFQWSMSVSRSKGQGGARRPCIQVGVRPRPGSRPLDPLAPGISHDAVCGSLLETPNLLAVVNEVVNPPTAVLVMAFRPAVHKVRLYLGHRGDRLISLSLVPSGKAKKADVEQFRYAGLAFLGDFCLNRFVTYSGTGAVLDQGERMPCTEPSAASRLWPASTMG